MREETKTLRISGVTTKLQLQFIEERDRAKLRKLYKYWSVLNKGMKLLKSRGINMPEGISESAFCLCKGINFARVINANPGPRSFDVIDIKRKKRIQVKAVSVEKDLTSFGPRSVWDELFFLDFYRKGKFDGSFDVYKIPNNLIYNHHVNSKQTFRDQQKLGRRPRLRMKSDIIKVHKIKPIKTFKI